MRRRFRVDAVDSDVGGRIDLGAVRRHLEVVRARIGDLVYLFDGHGAEVEAEIVAFDGSVVAATVRARVSNHSESDLECWLIQALPARAARMDAIVRQTTELGVHRIVPVIAERSQHSGAKPATMQRRRQRWARIAAAAAEQSCRAVVPEVAEPGELADIDWDSLAQPILIAEPGAGPMPQEMRPAAVSVLVGPEGGWTEAEVNAALDAGATLFGLGPRVLRADSAAVVALTLVQSRWGDLATG